MTKIITRRPSYRDLLASRAQPTGVSWEVFANNPQRGTLNLITPERIGAAVKCIKAGKVFSLNWELTEPEPGLFQRKAGRQIFTETRGLTDGYLTPFCLQSSSHWDALSHVHHPERGHYLGLNKITRPTPTRSAWNNTPGKASWGAGCWWTWRGI